MPMVPFFTKLPEIAAVETRELIILNNPKIPGGAYGLWESYCDELDCDCRRVFINVVPVDSPEDILATISYGWETPKFYKKWMGTVNQEFMEMMTHPFLEEEVNRESTVVKRIKIGRNESYPCGSGKKYKKCCGGTK